MSGFGHFGTFLQTKSYLILYILDHLGRWKGTWSSFLEGDFFFKRETQRISRRNKGKNKKSKCSSFCIQDNLYCCCFLVCCRSFCCCYFSFLYFVGPPGTAGLVTQHVYLANGCESTQTRTAASTSALGSFHLLTSSQAKQSTPKKAFLHSAGANLNLCLTNARVKSDT